MDNGVSHRCKQQTQYEYYYRKTDMHRIKGTELYEAPLLNIVEVIAECGVNVSGGTLEGVGGEKEETDW